jgi:uncharacterized membrane protein
MKKIIFIGMLMILVLTGCKTGTTTSTAQETGGFIEIPLSDLSSTVNFYELNDGGINIKYFAVLGSDGEIRTAFDACDICGGYKGYEQVGSDIRCKNCGKVFKIDGLGTKNKGYGCWPSYLPHEVSGDKVLIKVSDITNGKSRFV